MKLRFSPANAKTTKLQKYPQLKKYLQGRKIYSLDFLSGVSCMGARDCLAYVVHKNGKKKLKDGPKTEFRCFSASQEVLYGNVFNLRKHNLDLMRQLKTEEKITNQILADIPKNCGILRLSVAGDIISQEHFNSLVNVAQKRQDILFYGYTKSLPYWTSYIDTGKTLPSNLVLTASKGGKYDNLIDQYKLRSAKVVYSQYQAKRLGLPVDHSDIHAADPAKKNQDFALVIHGQGPKNSKHAKAWQRIKKNKGGYSR